MSNAPLDSRNPPDEDGHEARIVRLEVNMENVVALIHALQARMDEGFLRVDDGFRRVDERLRALQAQLEAYRQEWRKEFAALMESRQAEALRWEDRWREELRHNENRWREEQRQSEKHWQQQVDKMEQYRRHEREWAEQKWERNQDQLERRWNKEIDERNAKDAEFRSGVRWVLGILVSLNVAAIGLLGRAVNLY